MSAPFEGLGTFYLGKEVDTDTSDLTDDLVLYDAQDLTTHGFIVGMTGSGKTGLGVSLIEEAALDGIPVIAIDPKGDLGNLALTFPQLAPADFRPYIDESEATREGVTPDELASQKAALWTKGLGEWGQDGDRLQRLRNAATVSIYTPGATSGLQLSVLGALTPPEGVEPGGDAFRDRVDAAISSILSLVGIEADPLASPEHVFLSKVVGDAWAAGKTLTIADLIRSLQTPPFTEIGVMQVDTFYPANKRTGLAMKLNGLLASPGFSAWTEGEPLDAGRLLYGDDGKPRVSVLSIGHLSDDERMFFVTRLLGEVVGWMRAQSGTSSLRAILYMDEIFGYLPPQANPPSKTLLLTLLKQARAFGLGVVLATQNPVDLDYKALSNCGTWFVGRLQTENDKARLLDGLEGAAQGGIDRADVDRILSGIGKRRFLLHNVHEGAPVLMQTRWAMSYLAGPMSRDQIDALMADQKTATVPPSDAVQDVATATEAVAAAPAPTASSTPEAASSKPDLGSIPQIVVDGDAPDVYVPMLLARAEVPYSRASIDLNHTERYTLLTEVDGTPDWSAADALAERPQTASVPADGATFAPVPDALADAGNYSTWEKDLKKWIQSERPVTVLQSNALKTTSEPGEDERSFRIRLGQLAREARDEKKQALKTKYGKKLDALEKRMKSAETAIDREEAQASQRKMDTVVRVGTTLLGAFLGGGRRRSTLSQIGVTARSAGRMSKEASDVKRAEQKLDGLQADYADLDAELQREMDHIDLAFTPETAELETIEVTPKQTEMHITELALAWVPYRRDADGRLERA